MISHEHKKELMTLLEAMCNAQLSGEEATRLQEILRDHPAAQETYFAYLDMHLGLKQIALLETGNELSTKTNRARRPGGMANRFPLSTWHRAVAACGIALAIGVLAWLMMNPPRPPASEHSPSITRLQGSVRLVNAQGQSREATLGMALAPGGRLETGSGESLVELTYHDGTQLTLLNESSITPVGDQGKRLTLNHGIVSADVAPQPAKSPMLVSTPGAKIEVLGTRFALAATSERTELNVSEGRVRVTRVADGQTVEVIEGQSIITNGEVRLSVQESQGPREVWEEDFEQGVPKGWNGLPIATKLPKGSRGGIQPMKDNTMEPPVHVIACRDEWVNGLFQIQEGTHLHITLKMDRPNWLNVFFSTRDADSTKPTWALHIFNEVPFWKHKPGEWWTLTIPLKEFRRKRDGVFHEEPPLVGEVAYSLSLSSTEDDRGLVIDRIWVTRDGPGEVESHPVP